MNVWIRHLFLLCVLAAGIAEAAEGTGKTNSRVWRITLVSNDVAGVTIVCDTANRFDDFAARELQRCVQAFTGVELPVVDQNEQQTVTSPCVYIGDTAFARVMGDVGDDLEAGAYRMRFLPRALVITAHNTTVPANSEAVESEQAIACAVYELVARLCTFKWDEPGVLAENVAPKKRLTAAGAKPIDSSIEKFHDRYVLAVTGSGQEPTTGTSRRGDVKPKLVTGAAGKRYAHRRILPHAAQSWCVSTDTNKLNLVITEKNGEYVMNDIAAYKSRAKSIYYFVNWDLVGTVAKPGRIESYRVEQDRLYMVHIYEINAPDTLGEFWKALPGSGKNGYVAWVWVGRGEKRKDTGGRVSVAEMGVEEIRETPDWFYFNPRERLPMFSRQFPQFTLPETKHFSIPQYSVKDKARDYLARGVSQLRGAMAEGQPARRRALTIGDYFADGLEATDSGDPHISPTENAFMHASYQHVRERMDTLKENGWIFLDEEFWHNDYQPETVERLIVAIRRGLQNNPELRIGDWWGGVPYNRGFMKPVEGNAPVFDPTYVERDYAPEKAATVLDDTFTMPVTVEGKKTTLGDELTLVPINLYVGAAFAHPETCPKGVAEADLTVATAMHKTRINRMLALNKNKPTVWFAWGFLDLMLDHPLVHFPTEVRNPDGVVLVKDRIQISPDLCEAIAFFSFFEADGCHMWDGVGVSSNDPNDIINTFHWWAGEKQVPRLAEWVPEKRDAPPRQRTSHSYPYCLRFDVDYFALGAWKYAEVASLCERGTRQDLPFSLDGGRTWIQPPKDGSVLCQSAKKAQPIVVGAVTDERAAVAIYQPYQAPNETTQVTVKLNHKEYTFDILGKRVHVYRVTL